MNNEWFFEKFALIADAPGAVDRLRQLILTLAMQGKLVPQCPDDEPATVLVAKLKSTEITENGRLRKVTSLPELTIDELPFDLPPGWVWQRLGCVGETNIGLTYSPNDLAETGVPVLRSSNIQNGKLDFGDIVRVKYEPKKSVMVQNGDLLICARNGSKALVGKVAVIENLTEPAAFGAFMAIFRSRINQYLYYFISSPLFRRMIDEVNTTTINQITQNNLRTTLAPIPPLAEQKRIVAKVDELMGMCDELEAQQQERELRKSVLIRSSLSRFAESPTSENLGYLFHNSYDIPPSELRKSILTLAVQGKLVPQDPEDRPAGEEVEVTRRQRGLPPAALTAEKISNMIFEAPASWCWVTVSDVAENRLGKMLDEEKNSGTPQPYLRNTNVHWFHFDLNSIKTILMQPQEIDEFRLSRGDVMICEGGHGIARTAVWEDQIPGVMFQKALHRVRPFECLNPYFFAFCIRVYEVQGILGKYYTGAGIPHFTGRSLAKLVFPLPPLAEQHRIVAKVDQLMALVDELERQQEASLEKASNLLDAIVHEMTSGG